MKILIIDNYDSFTYNIVHIIREAGFSPDVIRNDEIDIAHVNDYDKIIISPGPGIPSEAGLLPHILSAYAHKKSILGVCLGHQAIGECFGARLRNMGTVMHGIATPIHITGDDYIFKGLPHTFQGGRYHSWVIDKADMPSELVVTACADDGEIMAVKHREYDVHGIQFHPESVLTPLGATIITNFLNH